MLDDIETTLSEARTAIKKNKIYFIPRSTGLVEEFEALDIGDSEEIQPLLAVLLQEIKAEHFVNSRPQMLDQNSLWSNINSYNFVWKSKKMKKEMSIEFAINDGHFYYYSLNFVRKK